jgi:muramoyltetrapeptide carboxypeptidase
MSLVIPSRLKVGDTVAVVATARAVDYESVEAGVKILIGWGLKVELGKALYHRHQLFAGTDQERLEDLQRALDNPRINAIFCARGGYGTTRILDSISWKLFTRHPKWVCGFSDITALLCHIHSLGYACLHSTMPQLFNGNNAVHDHESLKAALFDLEVKLEAAAHPENRIGICDGPLVGGNLSLLVHLFGTRSEVDTKGKILIIEEVDEYLYHLDRMMVQFKRTGKLQQLAGLIVGHLTKMKEGDLKFGMSAAGVIRSHLQDEDIPIGFGFPFGHHSPNLAVPLGLTVHLEVTEHGSKLTFP